MKLTFCCQTNMLKHYIDVKLVYMESKKNYLTFDDVLTMYKTNFASPYFNVCVEKVLTYYISGEYNDQNSSSEFNIHLENLLVKIPMFCGEKNNLLAAVSTYFPLCLIYFNIVREIYRQSWLAVISVFKAYDEDEHIEQLLAIIRRQFF